MDPKTMLESAANELMGLSNAATSDKIGMLEMVQLPLNMILAGTITKDMQSALDSISSSIEAEKKIGTTASDQRILTLEEVVLELVRQCLLRMPV
ncbi:MAG: hypothetical protein P4L53_23355 [Candidatus Obscuribacterales bacterium]|nr:hypothetical protein [Candidatus Obscuribacterales bacterium]